MDIVKTCKTCLLEKKIECFHKHLRCKYGVRNECKICRIDRQVKYQKDNKDNYLAYQSKHYQENKDQYRKMALLNPKRQLHKRNDYEKNRSLYLFRASLRKKHVKVATPKWADMLKVRDIYLSRPDGFHVDHIVPLRGKNVCGLHVEYNLQIIPSTDNLRKGNKLWI